MNEKSGLLALKAPEPTGCRSLATPQPFNKRPCLIQWLLPFLVDHSIKLDNAAPSLQYHYEPSSLLRAAPPLCPASVLSFSWGFHLNFSLSIGAAVSRVLHRSLNQSHATFMPDAAQAVNRFLPRLILAFRTPPVSTSPISFDTSSVVHLRSSLLIHT